MRTLITSSFIFLAAGCSVYQNSGRKYLEKNAYEYAGLKLHDQTIGCAAPGDDAWADATANARARVRERATARGYELRVEPVPAGEAEAPPGRAAFACDYVFATEAERAESVELAIDATLFARERRAP